MGNFRRWKNNPQIIMAFALGFIICFLLSDKAMVFADNTGTVLQILEPFIWTFGDANSVLIISLCLLLLFGNMPNLNNEVPFQLVRISRIIWMLGQIVYLVIATFIYVLFILFSTAILSSSNAYVENMWSPTAAILGYSNIGNELSIPSFVKVMELSTPYIATLHIFGLMIGYSLFMASLMLFLNLWNKKGGMIGGIVFSGLGFLLTPDVIASWFSLSQERINIANIAFGWISPLNQATYYMHNFGYDNLPKLWVSYIFFAIGSLILFLLSLIKIKKYQFNFTGTQR
jgi:hypothetical protein